MWGGWWLFYLYLGLSGRTLPSHASRHPSEHCLPTRLHNGRSTHLFFCTYIKHTDIHTYIHTHGHRQTWYLITWLCVYICTWGCVGLVCFLCLLHPPYLWYTWVYLYRRKWIESSIAITVIEVVIVGVVRVVIVFSFVYFQNMYFLILCLVSTRGWTNTNSGLRVCWLQSVLPPESRQ